MGSAHGTAQISVLHKSLCFTRIYTESEVRFVTTVDWPAGVRWQSARDPELSLCTRISSTSAVTTRRDTTFFAQSVTPPSSGTRTSRKTRLKNGLLRETTSSKN